MSWEGVTDHERAVPGGRRPEQPGHQLPALPGDRNPVRGLVGERASGQVGAQPVMPELHPRTGLRIARRQHRRDVGTACQILEDLARAREHRARPHADPLREQLLVAADEAAHLIPSRRARQMSPDVDGDLHVRETGGPHRLRVQVPPPDFRGNLDPGDAARPSCRQQRAVDIPEERRACGT